MVFRAANSWAGRLAGLILSFTTLAFTVSPACAEKRMALVIGNSAYVRHQSLANSIADAKLIAKTLKALNFDVTLYLDLSKEQLSNALEAFAKSLERSGSDTTVFVYYAGHGVQDQDRVYLIPIDAQVEDEQKLGAEAVPAEDILSAFKRAGTRLNIVVLDACRVNPFAKRGGKKGLTGMGAPRGTLIAYSASKNEEAMDGPPGGNSPYTAALAIGLTIPGVQIEDVFKEVRAVVQEKTHGKQTPWEETSLVGHLYPMGRSSSVVASPAATELNIREQMLQETSKNVVKRFVRIDTKVGQGKLNHVTELPDGGFAAVGATTATGAGKSDIWVMRFDADGEVIWAKPYGGPLNDEGVKIAPMPEGGFIIAGRSERDTPKAKRGWLLHLDGEGNLLWNKYYGSDESNVFSGLAVLPNGFVLSGTALSKTGEQAAWVVRTDAQGKEIWSKKFGNSGDDYEANCIVALPRGGFAIGGAVKVRKVHSKGWITQLDDNGKVLWSEGVGAKAGEVIWDIVSLGDGNGVVVAGARVLGQSASENEAWVAKYDSLGKRVWLTGLNSVGGAFSVISDAGGGFTVAGNKMKTVDGKQDYDAWVAHLGGKGDVVWEKTNGAELNDTAASVYLLPNGGYAVVGTRAVGSGGQGEPWLYTVPLEKQSMKNEK